MNIHNKKMNKLDNRINTLLNTSKCFDKSSIKTAFKAVISHYKLMEAKPSRDDQAALFQEALAEVYG